MSRANVVTLVSIAGLLGCLLAAPDARAFVTPTFAPDSSVECPALRVLEGAWRASARTPTG